MKRTILIFITLLSLNYVNSQFENDKVLHFAGGSLFGLAGAGIAKQISNGNRYWTFAGSFGGALLVGIGKEAIDSGRVDNRWDNEDLLATALGGLAVGFTVDIFTNKKRKNKSNKVHLFNDNFYLTSAKNSSSTKELSLTSSIIYTE